MSYSQAEKLQILMLCDIYRALDIEDGFNPDVVEQAVSTDNYWALSWEYPSLSDQDDTPESVKLFVDTVDMFDLLDYTYKNLPDEHKQEVAEKVEFFSPESSFVFPGFDGNNEIEYLTIGSLLKTMDRFSGKDLTKNSHRPCVDMYRRMLEVFLPARRNFKHGEGIPKDDLINTLLAKTHPSNR
ncbi:YfbU family protein [Morganella morganii]|uniref:YfbU family protein n=1 Tax=Morganella TaxID=581 RepID=UPI00370CA2C1